MTFLLDTNLLLFSVYEQNRLTASARALLLNADHRFAFSAVSIWEVAIKHAKHPETFPADPMNLRDALLSLDYDELQVPSAQAVSAAGAC